MDEFTDEVRHQLKQRAAHRFGVDLMDISITARPGSTIVSLRVLMSDAASAATASLEIRTANANSLTTDLAPPGWVITAAASPPIVNSIALDAPSPPPPTTPMVTPSLDPSVLANDQLTRGVTSGTIAGMVVAALIGILGFAWFTRVMLPRLCLRSSQSKKPIVASGVLAVTDQSADADKNPDSYL